MCQSKGTIPASRESNTSHWQQVQAIIRDGAVVPDPRTQIITDLSRFIDERRNEGSEIILMADANESITDESLKWKEFVLSNSLHDVHSTLLQELPLPTRIGSKKRLDFIVATKGILNYAHAAGYRALHEAIVADHIMLWADFDLKRFFGGKNPSIIPPQGR